MLLYWLFVLLLLKWNEMLFVKMVVLGWLNLKFFFVLFYVV